MKLRIFIIVLTALALVLGVYFFVYREEKTPITDLVERIANEKDEAKKKALVDLLGKMQPSQGIEYKAMGKIRDEDVRKKLLENIQSSSRFNQGWIEMLDANKGDLDLIQAVMTAIARLTNKEDAPLLLDLLKKCAESKDITDGLLTQAAVAALATMKDEKAMKIMMKRPDLYFGHGGGSPLAQFGVAALPSLAKIANNPRNGMAWDAGRVIAQIHDPAAVPMLIYLARTGQKDAKLGAVGALAAMKVKEAEPVFQALVKDPDFQVREEVIRTLLESDFEGNFNTGVKVLESDDVGAVKSAVLEQMVKHAGAMDRVEAVMKKRVENEPRPDVREECMRKLMDLNYEKYRALGLDVLEKEDDPTAQMALIDYFADKKEQATVPCLKKLLTDEADNVRFRASRALLLITKKKYKYEETNYTRDEEAFEMRNNSEYRELSQ